MGLFRGKQSSDLVRAFLHQEYLDHQQMRLSRRGFSEKFSVFPFFLKCLTQVTRERDAHLKLPEPIFNKWGKKLMEKPADADVYTS